LLYYEVGTDLFAKKKKAAKKGGEPKFKDIPGVETPVTAEPTPVAEGKFKAVKKPPLVVVDAVVEAPAAPAPAPAPEPVAEAPKPVAEAPKPVAEAPKPAPAPVPEPVAVVEEPAPVPEPVAVVEEPAPAPAPAPAPEPTFTGKLIQ
jgi:translation initiation factor IF-2